MARFFGVPMRNGVALGVASTLPGWHANLRVLGEFDAETLADLAIDTPKNPARGWA